MLSRNRVLAVVLLAATAWATAATAAEAGKPFDVASELANQERIRRNVEAGAMGFSEISEDTRKELLERQDRLTRSISGRSYADLSDSDRTQASDDIAWINKTARDAADERQVCERTRKPGSNRVERVCMTARQQREAREKASRSLEGPHNTPSYQGR